MWSNNNSWIVYWEICFLILLSQGLDMGEGQNMIEMVVKGDKRRN